MSCLSLTFFPWVLSRIEREREWTWQHLEWIAMGKNAMLPDRSYMRLNFKARVVTSSIIRRFNLSQFSLCGSRINTKGQLETISSQFSKFFINQVMYSTFCLFGNSSPHGFAGKRNVAKYNILSQFCHEWDLVVDIVMNIRKSDNDAVRSGSMRFICPLALSVGAMNKHASAIMLRTQGHL